VFSLTFREHYRGVCSGFLGSLKQWDGLYVSHIKAAHAFNLPTDIEKPLISIATGTGIAPIRSMLQHRACLKVENNTVGKAYLFFGCNTPDTNYLYSDTDFEDWKEAGLLEVFPAFSGLEPKKYVQE
jgi:cytochrome P450/NADPH-cytochrome P450 reductase